MKARPLHRVTGLVLLLPLFGWAATGFVFFLKPGYAGAYAQLAVRTHPLTTPITIDPSWHEVRYFRTVLGDHLLARNASGWAHLDPATGAARAEPSESEFRGLLADAFTADPVRYGRVASVDGLTARTDTGVDVTLDWRRVTLQQAGADTARIEALYRVHYLQWTGVKSLDKVIGFTGLVLLVVLAVLGARLAFRR